MANWDPPQPDGRPEVPVTSMATRRRWRSRERAKSTGRGWASGGLVVLLIAAGACGVDDDGQLVTEDDLAAELDSVVAFVDTDGSAVSPTTASAAPATVPSTEPVSTVAVTTQPTTPATIAIVTIAPTTTLAAPTTTTTTTTTEPPPPPPPVSATPEITVTIRFDADGNDNQNKNDEWVRFTNSGSTAVDLTNWLVTDEGPKHEHTFERLVLEPGAAVTLYTGCGTASQTERFFCNSGSAIWNNDGDVVSLFDSEGQLIVQRTG